MAASDGPVRIRLGLDFLQVSCRGKPGLTDCFATSNPGEEFSFSLSYNKVEDTTDGDVDLLTVVQLQAVRCGRLYYLCATQNYHTHPYRYSVTFQAASPDGEAGEESQWVLTRIPGSKFLLESWLFRNYCLCNERGELCLQRVSQARRSKQLTFYPIREHPYHHRHRHRQNYGNRQYPPLDRSRSSGGSSYSRRGHSSGEEEEEDTGSSCFSESSVCSSNSRQ